MKILITRKISDQHKNLFPDYLEITDQSCIQYDAVDFQHTMQKDAIYVFSSARAVHYLFQEMEIIPNVQTVAIGSGTASALEAFPVHIIFNGEGSAASVSTFINDHPEVQYIFPISKQSLRAIQSGIHPSIDTTDIVCYSGSASDGLFDHTFDLVSATSPRQAMSAKNYAHDKSQWIAIGPTTAAQILELSIDNVSVAISPNEKDLVDLTVQTAVKIYHG